MVINSAVEEERSHDSPILPISVMLHCVT